MGVFWKCPELRQFLISGSCGRLELALRGRLQHVERIRNDPAASKDVDGCILSWGREAKMEILD
jgi:hypothetical protein